MTPKISHHRLFGKKTASGNLQQIINLIPPHRTYIECFAGSGTVINNKKPAGVNIAVEIDSCIIDIYHSTAAYTVINANAIDWLNTNAVNFSANTVIYCDPPYPHSVRSGKDRYKYEMTDTDHLHLLQLLNTLNAKIIISSYPNDLYNRLLSMWTVKTFQSMTHGGVRTEALYYNYSDITQLHQYDYLGKDYTDRQRIKRKICRWQNRLKQLPVLERNAILHALL